MLRSSIATEIMTTLYVGNVPYPATEDELRLHFSSAGTVQRLQRVTRRSDGRTAGFLFVEMADRPGADRAATELNGREFQGRNLRIELARPLDD